MKKTILTAAVASIIFSGAAIAESKSGERPVKGNKAEVSQPTEGKLKKADRERGKLTKAERKSKIFNKIDTNGDGVISKVEWDAFEFKKRGDRPQAEAKNKKR